MHTPANREPPPTDDLCAFGVEASPHLPRCGRFRAGDRFKFGLMPAHTFAIAVLATCVLAATAFGQGVFQTPAPPAALPAPPAIDRFLFQLPWSLATASALFVLAIIMARAAALMRTGKRAPLRAAAAALLLAAVGAGVIQALVTTKSEAIHDRTEQLVDAVSRGDLIAIDRLLAADATATYFNAPDGIDKDTIMDHVARQFGQGREANARIAELSSIADNERFGRSQLRVVVTHDVTAGYPIGSWWGIDWRAKPDGTWEAIKVSALGATNDPR
jgi:hypothetical protein